ncbi:DUF5933 domain-containing protein [Streptomyces thinghirensis]|nr:DUF5933 domain-containing protein [Streptomyces thinghirensis]
MALGFLITLEIAARRLRPARPDHTPGAGVDIRPASGPLLYASMALTMVVLTWRQRFIAAGIAVGIDVAIALVRWVADAGVTEGHSFGSGALWVILGCAVLAVTRRTGQERVLLLKGVGLACSWWPAARPVTPGC